MSVTGVLELFRTRPRHPVGADGRMALSDHLREVRARILAVTVMLTLGTVVAWFFFDPIFELLLGPYRQAQEILTGRVDTQPVINGVASPLLLRLKLSALTAIVVTSPFWLYQIWAFIMPGLHPNERRWTKIFAVVAGPLFLLGVATGYYVLPKGIEVLLGFTHSSLTSLVEFGEYFRFFTRMLLVFGISFEIPLFVVMLNLAGVVTGASLKAYRAWIVVGSFVFAAVATPSTDPFSMIMLAMPMTVLFLLSEGIARAVDRRRARARAHHALYGLSDDEASFVDDRPSPLGPEDD